MAAAALSPGVLVLMVAWAGWIAWNDWRRRRVPNRALWSMLLWVAVSLLALQHTPAGASALQSGFGFLLGLGLGLPGYLLRQLGAGDVKLIAVMGALQGWQTLSLTLLLSALLLGLAALLLSLHLGFAEARQQRLPAAVAICAGFLGSWLMPEWS